MSREWKPGDVAMMTWSVNCDGPFAVIRDIDRWHMIGRGSLQSDDFLTDGWLDKLAGVTIRPLVVIDPDDREQVERLYRIYASAEPETGWQGSDFLATALREFANPTPPKLEEPTGWLAVVEDERGVLWVRVLEGEGWHQPWARKGNISGDWLSYSDITAVRILSSGVTS